VKLRNAWIIVGVSAALTVVALEALAADDCNTTSQCREKYGSAATDCLNSQSSTSVCMCGGSRCASTPNPDPAPTGSVLGRIAVSSDGNFADCDDLFATAVTVAILAKTGNASKLRYYGHSDHLWGTEGGCKDGNREAAMQRSSAETARLYGGFDLSVFINAKANRETAINRLKDEINRSTSSNPLWIIAAGPMEVVGQALSRAASSRRQYVTVISHSTWNDNHADRPSGGESHRGWTWDEIGRMSSPPKRRHLPDQNGGLRTSHSNFYEWRDASDSRRRWLWSRNRATGLSVADCSDAGMAYWLATGRVDERASASEIKALLR